MPLTVLLRCNAINETRAWYGALLGFEVLDSAQGSLTVDKDGARLLFTADDLWNGTPRCTGTLYFSVPDVDAYFETLRGLVPVVWEPQDMPYGGREFGIRDCNGYILAFRQSA